MHEESHGTGTRVLLGAVLLLYGVATAGAIFGPALLGYPLVLALISPIGRHLFVAAGALDMPTFVVVFAARRALDGIGMFYVGRAYGDQTIEWLERRFVRFGRIVDWIVRVFRRAPYPVLFIAPTFPTYALSGSVRIRPRYYLPVMIAAQTAWMSVVYLAGDALSGWIEPAVAFVRAHVLEAVLLGVCLFVWARIRLRPTSTG